MSKRKYKLIKGLLIDVNNGEAKVIEVEDKLEELYKVLDCDCIDIIQRTIFGKDYTIVCDDEGLLKGNPKVSALTNEFRPSLVGNLLVVAPGADAEGNLIGLNDEEEQHLKRFICNVVDTQNEFKRKVLVGLNY